MQSKFTLRTFAELDRGKMGLLVDKFLDRAVADVRDRPGVDKAREVTLKIRIKPGELEPGYAVLEDFKVGFQVTSTVPAHKSTDYSMAADKSGKLLFNSHAPENPNQRTIDDELNNGKDDDNAG